MKRLVSDEIVFGGKLIPFISPPFSKSENGGSEPGFLSLKFCFLEFFFGGLGRA